MKVVLLRLDVITSHHSFLRVSRRLKSIYTLQAKTWQHDVRMVFMTLRTTIVHSNNQGVGLGPTSS
jgi:hypothetical protein